MAGSRVLKGAREACGIVDAVAATAELLEVGAAFGRGWRRGGGRDAASVIASIQFEVTHN